MSERTKFQTLDFDVVKIVVLDRAVSDEWISLGIWFREKDATEQEMLDTCAGINRSYECGFNRQRLLDGYRMKR